MTAEKDFIVRIENPYGFSSGLVYSPNSQSELVYVFTPDMPWLETRGFHANLLR